MAIPYKVYTPSLLEPTLLPRTPKLENIALELVSRSSALSHCLHPETIRSLGKLLLSMNSYYSNLIEGHITKLQDIERALEGHYEHEPQQRDLQLEAKAHIEVQALIDQQNPIAPTKAEFIGWIHQAFYDRLPPSLWVVTGEQTSALVQPGKYRKQNVVIGEHIPPPAETLPEFMRYFDRVYGNPDLSHIDRVLATAPAHHRLLWIHPFLDGNGRVARLFSHAYLGWATIGNQLWSISRGLARNIEQYRSYLVFADQQRRNDYDGRGNLTLSGLEKFTEFFLNVCIDQVKFMETRLQLDKLLGRIEFWCSEEVKTGKLKPGSFLLLKSVIMEGSMARGKAPIVTGREERQARSILKSLTDRGLLKSETPKGNVSLYFLAEVIDDWLPGLV